MTDQHYAWMRVALDVAQNSPDPSTQNGALLVVDGEVRVSTIETNRFPNGVWVTKERLERPTKYSYIEHAERNAIYAGVRAGLDLRGATLVCVWAACSDCARAIIGNGITTVVRYTSGHHPGWVDTNAAGDIMLREAKVEVITLTDPIPGVAPLLRDGKLWLPQGE